MTAPYSSRAVAALRESLFHEVEISVVDRDLTLDVADCTVTFDEGWSPHVRADFTTRVPEDQATLDALDPRLGVRVDINAGYIYPGGLRDVHPLARLRLVSREVSRPENRMGFSAVSDELLVQENTPMGASRVYGVGYQISALITDLIGWMLTGETISNRATNMAVLNEIITVETGANVWSVITDLADRINAWVYVDGAGTWNVVDRPELAGRSDYNLSVGALGTIEASTAALEKTDWANAVLLTYPDDSFVYAYAMGGPFSVNAVPTKVLTVRREASTDAVGLRQAAAEAILRRALSRGRSFAITAPSAYWLRPGMTVTVQLPTGPQERHLVSRVAFNLATGTMTLKTRVPIDVEITTGE